MLAHRMDHRGESHDPTALWFGCAPVGQHEMGIGGLERHLGCDRSRTAGIQRRTIAPGLKHPASIHHEPEPRQETFYVEEPDPRRPGKSRVRRTQATTLWSMLDVAYHARDPRHLPAIGREVPRFSEDQPFAGAWDSDTLTLIAFGPDQVAIEILQTAFAKGDIAIWVARHDDPLFAKPGLVVARPSRLDNETLRRLADHDLDADALDEADRSTGIRERIGERAYRMPWGIIPPSLSVRWRADTVTSAHPVVYWLQVPGDASASGWYTVESLEYWIDRRIDKPQEPQPYPARRRPTA